MKKLLSVLVAAAFAATGFNAIAQTKDVSDKSGAAVAGKGGTKVKRKEMKDKPKGGEMPKVEKRAKKEKAKPSEVKTKEGAEVKAKETKGVNK